MKNALPLWRFFRLVVLAGIFLSSFPACIWLPFRVEGERVAEQTLNRTRPGKFFDV